MDPLDSFPNPLCYTHLGTLIRGQKHLVHATIAPTTRYANCSTAQVIKIIDLRAFFRGGDACIFECIWPINQRSKFIESISGGGGEGEGRVASAD